MPRMLLSSVMKRALLGSYQGKLAGFLILVVVGSAGCGPNSDGSKMKEIEALETRIPIFPFQTKTREDRVSKGIVASICKYYKSEASYTDVQKFYVKELTALGWQYDGDRELKDWGTDLGGRQIEFRDKEYQFHIQYAGDKAGYAWNYATTVSWRK